jgi:hypothetical protein
MALQLDRVGGVSKWRFGDLGTPLPLGVTASPDATNASEAAEPDTTRFETLLGRLHRLCAPPDRPARPAAPDRNPEPPRDRPARPAAQDRKTEPPQRRTGSGPLLRYGVRGEPVKKLQQRLKELGFDPGPIDGIFGPKTRHAVRAFQGHERIDVDGIVGPQTWGRLGIHVRGTVTRPDPGSSLDIVLDGNMASVQGYKMTAGTARAFVAMARAASHDGFTLRINSAYRSDAQQAVLWRQALAKYGSAAAARKWVAPPGHSQHRTGRALDIHTTDALHRWLRGNAPRFGFRQPMSWEPWHWEHSS